MGRIVLTAITGAVCGALAGGLLLLFSSWLYLPDRTHISPKANWMLFGALMGAGYGCLPGLTIGPASGLMQARRPAAALIGLGTGGVLAVVLFNTGAA